jgi:uncharacterized protein (TIGR03382 family)
MGSKKHAEQFCLNSNSYTHSASALSVIPEPSTVMLGGLGVLALLRRRRN